MASRQEPAHTPAEYLALEREAAEKHEYLNGRLYAMMGVTRSHVRITANALASLHAQFRDRPCEVFDSDMRVRVDASGLYTYPDVSALCGEPRFAHEELDVLLSPTVLVEALPPSTEGYDRGDKFEHYRKIPTLQEYVPFSQDRPRGEHYARRGAAGDRWDLTVVGGFAGTVELPTTSRPGRRPGVPRLPIDIRCMRPHRIHRTPMGDPCRHATSTSCRAPSTC